MTYDKQASASVVKKAMKSLADGGYLPELVQSRGEAMDKVKSLIPAGVSVMNGSSRTLEEIGFVQYLKDGRHGWNNLHEAVLAEKDAARQAVLRKQAVLSDFYVGSAQAVTEGGEIIIASNSGSQLPHVAFTSQNVILVVGTQKIVRDYADAIRRLEGYVYPLEDKRMKEVGFGGSFISKILALRREPSFSGRKFHVILVNEKLGF